MVALMEVSSCLPVAPEGLAEEGSVAAPGIGVPQVLKTWVEVDVAEGGDMRVLLV